MDTYTPLRCKHRNPLAVALFALLCTNPLIANTTSELQPEAEDVAEQSALPAMDCIVEPSELVELGSGVPGVLRELAFERNDFVKTGDIVARLESDVEKAALNLATARAEMDATLRLRSESAAFGIRTEKRNQKLFEDSTISAQDMDRVKTETLIAVLQEQQELDNQRIAILEAERARQALIQRTITSPIDGVIMERYKSVGEYLEAEAVYKIARLDPLNVELIVPVSYFGQIERGMQASISLEVETDQITTDPVATVTSVDRVADAASGTYTVTLSLPNAGYRIPSGLRCQLEFIEPADDAPSPLANAED